MNIFDRYVRPVHVIRAEIDSLLQKGDTNIVMMQIASRLEAQAEAEALLDAVNATTACENGLTLCQNLRLQGAARIASNIARRKGLLALASSYEDRVAMYRGFINSANSKQTGE